MMENETPSLALRKRCFSAAKIWMVKSLNDCRTILGSVYSQGRSLGMNKDRSLLTDAQWARLSPLLPGQERSPGTTARDTRLFVEAVLWRARCGTSWRDLPAERFGPWHTVYARFRRWRQAGVWPYVLAQVQNPTGLHRLLVDSTAIRAHQVAAGAKKKTAPSGRRSAAAGAVLRPSSTSVATHTAGFAPWP